LFNVNCALSKKNICSGPRNPLATIS
jgi:hypothetical protein